MSIFSGIFYFIVLVGILVFIHEGGHFLAAKFFKVKVFVFSLGMGPRLFGFKKGETEYRISAVPIGGYVKMLGEDPAEEPAEDELENSMLGISPWKKIVIYIAGPLMNLVFPLFLYFFLALGQDTVPPARVGMVIENSPASEAGLKTGDTVTAINGSPVYSFNHMVDMIQKYPEKEIILEIEREGQKRRIPIVPSSKTSPRYNIPLLRHLTEEKGQIGILGIYPNTVIGVKADSIAHRAGLSTFDRIVSLNGKEVEKLHDLQQLLRANAGDSVVIRFNSLKENLPKEFFPDEKEAADIDIDKQESLFEDKIRQTTITPPENFRELGQIGISSSMGHVLHVEEGGPADMAGLKQGDRLVAIDGHKSNPFDIVRKINRVNSKGTDTLEHRLTWVRNGRFMSSSYKPDYISAGNKKDLGVEHDRIDPGFHIRPYSREWFGKAPSPSSNPAPFLYAMHMSWTQTLFWSRVILDVLWSVLKGGISPKSFSGPIGIGHAAAKIGNESASAFFGFMGFISLNLGLLNLLLPIPILDGGRLVLIVAEVVMRRKLSQKIQERIMVLGAVMVLLLLVWAVVMDVTRLFVG